MNLQKVFDDTASHYVSLVQQKGWYAYARGEVHKLDEDDSGLFRGIRLEVARQLKAMGFVVPKNERGEWWT